MGDLMGYVKPKSTILASAMEKPKANERPTNLLLTLPEAWKLLRISKTSLYRLLNENVLKDVRIRGRRFVPQSEIHAYIAAQLTRGAA